MSVAPHSIERAQRVAAALAGMQGLVAVSLGGSAGAGLADASSDLDLHVYWRGALASVGDREARIRQVADPSGINLDVRYWGLEDHLFVDGQLVELVYVPIDDLQADIERAYGEGLAGEGYVTAQFFSVANGVPIYDPKGVLSALRERLLAGYPEPTRRWLLEHNPFLLRFYLKHLRQAQQRGDLLFVQHRRYTVQMVFFNLLFALNRRYHPGEKRLLIHGKGCPIRPKSLAERWSHIALLPANDPALVDDLTGLIDELCTLAEANQ